MANNVETPNSTSTLYYRRQHPGGGPLGRCSYGVPGVKGIVVFDMGLFPSGVAPATIVLNVELSKPAPAQVAAVTSAVIAAANTAVAQATSTPIAPPAQVAAVVAQGAAVLESASKPSAKPSKSSK